MTGVRIGPPVLVRQVPSLWDDPEIVAAVAWLTKPWYRRVLSWRWWAGLW